MSLKNAHLTIEEVIDGIDATTPTNFIQSGYCRSLINFNLSMTSGIEKRKGCRAQLSSPWTGHSIWNGIEFGNFKYFFGIDATSGKIGYENASAITVIPDLTLSKDYRASLLQHKTNLYVMNGFNVPKVYNNTASYELGLEEPPDITNFTQTTGGSLVKTATYLWAYTYVARQSGELVAESSPCTLEMATLTGDNNKVTFTVTASTSSRVTGIRIYRSYANGSVLFLENEIPNNTGTYESTMADSELDVIQLVLDNSPLSSWYGEGFNQAQYPLFIRGRLFLVNGAGTLIRYSRIGQEGFLTESFPATSFIEVSRELGKADYIVGLSHVKETPIILRKYSIGILEEVGLADAAKAADDVVYIYRELTNSVGAISHFAQVRVNETLVFLGRDNIYITDGSRVEPIGNLIKTYILDMNRDASKFKWISAGNDTENKRIYFSIFKNINSNTPDLVLVGDYQQFPKFRWTTYESGVNPSTHPGIKAGCFLSFINALTGAREIFFGNVTNDGQYYKMDTGKKDYIAFDGTGGNYIYCQLTSRAYSADNPSIEKLFKEIFLRVILREGTPTFSMSSLINLDNTEIQKTDFAPTLIGGTWENDETPPLYGWTNEDGSLGQNPQADTALYWQSGSVNTILYDPHLKTYYYQFIFRDSSSESNFSLLNWTIKSSLFSVKIGV